MPAYESPVVGDERGGADLLVAGATLGDRYRIEMPLGRGGMGEVYVAEDLRLGRQVAIKVLRKEVGRSNEARRRFEREARATARIVSDHVVTIFDFGLGPNERPYLVMEYLAGQTVRSLLDSDGPLTPPRAARIVHDVCLGIEAAHARGVIHRDLKPENLLLVRRDDGSQICKVLDFGLAKVPILTSSEAATVAGLPMGTLHYMSPEQARGDIDIDERTDIYGCCAVLYEMLTGKPPHSADSHHALLYKIVHETPQRIEQLCPFLPLGLADAVRAGLQRDRRLRPVSVNAFRCSIAPYGRGKTLDPIHEPSETLADEPATFGRGTGQARLALAPKASKRTLSMLAAGALLGCLLTLAGASSHPPARAGSTARSDTSTKPPAPATSDLSAPLPRGLAGSAEAVRVISTPAPSVERPKRRPQPVQQRRTVSTPASSADVSAFERENPYSRDPG
jgi:serine/threonine protein kinase